MSLGDETAKDLQETSHTLVVALISDVIHILVQVYREVLLWKWN